MHGIDLPKISVVTSCFNAEEHIAATLHSVLDQGYPSLEYIVVDGASTDNTLPILQRHVDRFAVLTSAPDAGQYHGIQKGMALATGEVMAWLNGDDVYCPWTLALVGEVFARFPAVQWIIGTPAYMNGAGMCIRVSGNSGTAYPQRYIRNGWFRPAVAGNLQQESMFWRKSLWDKVGGLDLGLSYAADYDLWRRFAAHADLVSVTAPLALFRQRPGEQRSSKGQHAYEAEVHRVGESLRQPPWIWRVLGGRGESLRHLCRMLVWKRAHVISYSNLKRQWVMTQSWRPLARTSLADLMLERSLRISSSVQE